MTRKRPTRSTILGAGSIAVAAIVLVVFAPGWVAHLRDTHGAVSAFTALLDAANRGDLGVVEDLCTPRYLKMGTRITLAEEGGVVGLPRNINKNFQVWREGRDVLLCPTNRIGPVYRFVRKGDRWKFDGPAGVLVPGGQFVKGEEMPDGPDGPR